MDAATPPHRAYLILHNVAKKRNFGEILRTAAAMGVTEACVVGAQKLSAHGAQVARRSPVRVWFGAEGGHGPYPHSPPAHELD